MQFSALLEQAHDVSNIGTFGLVKFIIFFPTQDISDGVVGGKTTNFDFVSKKAFMMGTQ